MSILANITIISSGMGLGFPAVTLHELTNPANSSVLSIEQASWFASITSIMCPFGGLLSGYLLERIGRKNTLISINIISIVAWGLLTFSSQTNSNLMYIEIMISRVIIGVAIGMSSAPSGIYSAEICHPDLRGRLTLLGPLFTGFGILFIYLLGYFIPTSWRLVSGIAAIFTVISLVVTLPLPESPTFLIGKSDLNEAEKSLRKLNCIKENEETPTKIVEEIKNLVQNLSNSSSDNLTEGKLDILKRPEVYKPLTIMISFFAFQQFSGIFVIIVYGTKFAVEAGVTIDPFLCTVFIGLTRVLTTFLMGYLSDRFGRKPPAVVSGIGMTICMFGLSACSWSPTAGTAFDWVPVVLLLGFFFSATLGFLTLPFSMISEVFPQKFKGFCTGLTIFIGYTMSFFCIKFYPDMIEILGNEFLFIIYGSVSLLGIVFIVLCLPETRGKSLYEIEAYFRGDNKNKNCLNI